MTTMTNQTKLSIANISPIKKAAKKFELHPCNSTELHNRSSSSEVSCETIIFVEGNGRRHFAAHDRPPLPGRSGQIKLGISTYKTRPSSASKTRVNEVWIDGPRGGTEVAPKQSTPTKILTPSNELNLNEIWIDGPNAVSSNNQSSLMTHFFDSMKEKYNEHSKEKTRRSKVVEEPQQSESGDSTECLDRQLLRQLNEHDADIVNAALKLNPDSRPISLLSFHSAADSGSATSITSDSNNRNMGGEDSNDDETQSLTNEDDLNSQSKQPISYEQKLEDLKTSSEQMIFKQSCKEMESLHKTLETFLTMGQVPQLHMRPVRSTILSPTVELRKNVQAMSEQEKEKRLSRLLSPTRFRPTSQIQSNIYNLEKIQQDSAVEQFERPNFLEKENSDPSASLHSSICSSSSSSQSPGSFANNLYSSPVESAAKDHRMSDYSEPFDNLKRSINQNFVDTDAANNVYMVKNISRRQPIKRNIKPNNNSNRLFYN